MCRNGAVNDGGALLVLIGPHLVRILDRREVVGGEVDVDAEEDEDNGSGDRTEEETDHHSTAEFFRKVNDLTAGLVHKICGKTGHSCTSLRFRARN